MSILNPFQLLELNVISAQDLAPVSRSMRTYAVAWVHPDRKLSTRVDTHSHNNPTWNDKFVFRVDEDFLHNDTSAVMIEIYALHWFKDVHVGTVRILVGNLIPARAVAATSFHGGNMGMRFVALQVRRQSGRPQGILNIGVAILHSAMRSMPIYSQLSTSAVGYRELMGEEDPTPRSKIMAASATTGPDLRRTKSDTSSMIGSEIRAKEFRGRKGTKASSMIGSDATTTARSVGRKKRSKASSMVSAAAESVARGKAGNSISTVNNGKSEGLEVPRVKKKKGKIGRAISVISGSSVGVDPPRKGRSGKPGKFENPSVNGYSDIGSYEESDQDVCYFPPKKAIEVKPIVKALVRVESAMGSPRVKPSPRFNLTERHRPMPTPRRQYGQPGKSPFHAPYEYGTPRKTPMTTAAGRVFLTESELGPSPSEVAAAIAKRPVRAPPTDDGESSVLGGWSVDESVEGLRSKLDRWRTELPPVYDRGELSSYPSTESRHVRRHTEGGGNGGAGGGGSGNGLFSCFSNICGVECSIVCGGGGSAPSRGNSMGSKKIGSERMIRSPSTDTLNFK